MPTRTEAVKRFLMASTHPDLGSLYSANMECQVNVAQDGGERIESEFQGKAWQGWTDGVTTWKPFRIPYNAAKEPTYEDKEIKYDLAEHVEAIGMTGWDWKNRCSRWIAYDFDGIVGHSDKHAKKLTNEELEAVKQALFKIDWVTIRKSTSGTGLHVYVFLEPVETNNHNEHAALGRAILGMLSALAGFDFHSKVDICGGNMWVWHRKMQGTDGLTLIKKGTILNEVPPNWKNHLKVVTGSRRKNLPQEVESKESSFEEFFGQHQRVPLDEEHKKVIEYLRTENAFWWWDQDHHMLVTHTGWLQKAHNDLDLRGFFATNSPSTNLNEQNCFCSPLRRGSWVVRRFSLGVSEHPSWDQDGAGWTRTYLNREPDLRTAAKAYGGLEDKHGNFVFQEAEVAAKAARLLGVNLDVGIAMGGRETKLTTHRDGRLVVSVERKDMDLAEKLPGYLANKKEWLRIYNTQVTTPSEPEAGNYDDIVRHLVTETQEDYGWMIKSEGEWRYEPLAHVKVALGSMGLNQKDITSILGSSVFKCWKVVNKPFQPEYPGDREWNRNAAQLKFVPSKDKENLNYPTWHRILEHCGSGLNEAIKNNGWCKVNGIKSGGDYLKCWIASLFQEPLEPLPYLFLYGPQNSGKSILHEALSMLLTKGYMRADAALISQSMFNGELEGAIVCVVEETDLRRDRLAYNRIKDWVTSKHLLIHHKGRTPYHIPNSAHFIHTANEHQACPIFTGDTRITMIYVGPIEPLDMIPKKMLLPLLEKEAPDFLAELTSIELPPSNDRLNVPIITTEDKNLAQELNQTEFERFIAEKCNYIPGAWIKFSDLYDRFIEAVDPNEMHKWTKVRVGRSLPPNYPKGRNRKDGQYYIGNIGWSGVAQKEDATQKKLVLQDGYLVPSEG